MPACHVITNLVTNHVAAHLLVDVANLPTLNQRTLRQRTLRQRTLRQWTLRQQ